MFSEWFFMKKCYNIFTTNCFNKIILVVLAAIEAAVVRLKIQKLLATCF
jgi:hypothetical protein